MAQRKAKSKKQRNAKSGKEFDIEGYRLSRTDKKIFKLQQQYPELKQIEIAKILKILETSVSRIVNKPAYRNAWHDYEKDWLSQLADARRRAANRLTGLIDSKDERIALQASKEILQLNKIDIGLSDTSKSKLDEISGLIKEVSSLSGFSAESPGDSPTVLQPEKV